MPVRIITCCAALLSAIGHDQALGRVKTPAIEIDAGDLRLSLVRERDGLQLQSLFDRATECELLAANPLPLFRLTLRHVKTKEEVQLGADNAWQDVDVPAADADGATEIHWRRPQDERLAGVRVLVRAEPDRSASAVRWTIKVECDSDSWSVWRVVFPQLALADIGKTARVFFPRGPGEVKQATGKEKFRFQGLYPNGWTTMQFFAVYSDEPKTGLYFAVHDPFGSTKDIAMESGSDEHPVLLRCDHPAPDMGRAGNGFTLSGQAVWQLLRGDWFDAATIYRDWVRREARWYPQLGDDGRTDTPKWMRQLCIWSLASGPPDQVVPAVKEFAQWMGVPVGVHWYNWHQIPFDNDYPHYFPTKEGFADGVRQLQAAGVRVMPYINGRLWDTRDRGAEDFQFSGVALPAVTKGEDGEPYTETYGSKEADDSPVRLGVMCPATPLWRDRVRGIVLRLLEEVGLDGVYIDQVAAASPKLCFDSQHGHPLGGGHWWNEGYWRLLEKIRQVKSDERMLTTECNAEPFVRWFDGYLTWHWQHDGQVPAFPAVYGGALQMFGRAYRGGDTKDLALRMKAGQQLVFGEQIGWINPGVVQEKENAEFLRQIVRLRWRLRRYFYAGQMARPPKLAGEIPTVRADWQWSGQWWVTTDAVLAGAWSMPAQKKLALLFVNVSDQPVSARLDYDAAQHGLETDQVEITTIRSDGPDERSVTPARLKRELSFPPRTAWAWEMSPVEP